MRTVIAVASKRCTEKWQMKCRPAVHCRAEIAWIALGDFNDTYCAVFDQMNRSLFAQIGVFHALVVKQFLRWAADGDRPVPVRNPAGPV